MRRPVVKPRAAFRRRKLVYVLVGSTVLAALAPTIIGAIGLHNQFLRGVLPSEAGTLTAQNVSFGWFSPTRLDGVRVRTPDGKVLLEVPSLTLDRTILDLVGDSRTLGAVRAEQPVLRIVASDTGSNLEAFVGHLLAASEEEQSPLSCTLAVAGGRIEVQDEPLGQTAVFTIEEAACELLRGDLATLRAALTHATADAQPGRLTVHVAPHGDTTRQLDVAARNWPLQAASAWLRREVEEAHTTGLLTLDATATWSGGAELDSSGTATLTDLTIDAASLGRDRLSLSELRIPWKLRTEGDRLLVDELSLSSDFGQVHLRGAVPLRLAGGDSADNPAADVLRLPFAATGSVDLARLAVMLPDTLRIKSGVSISSGRADFNLESRPGDPVQHWSGSLAVTDLAAQDHNRALRWERPVIVAATVRHDGQWAVESLTCQSDFLQLSAAGDMRQMDATVDFDLSRLASDLGRFVDIAQWNLGGRGTLRAQWRPAENGAVRTSVSGSVNALRFVDGHGRLWQEPSVQLQADVLARLPEGDRPLTLESGSQLTVNTVKDHASLKLNGPLVVGRIDGRQAVGPGELRVEGDLAGWLDRLSPWLKLDPWRVEGGARLVAALDLSPSAVMAESLELVLTNLQAVGPGWRIQEPQVTLQTSGRYIPAARTFELGETTLVGSSASLRARNTRVGLRGTDSLPQIRSEAAFLFSLQRIDAWRIGTDGRPLPLRPAGTAKGTVRIEEGPKGLDAEVSATVTEFAVHEYVAALGGRQPGYRPAWQEEEVALAAKAAYAEDEDRWEIQQAAVRSNSLAAAVVGSVSDVAGRCEAELRGTIEYDLADVGPIVAAQLGLDLAMTGREQATFELIGPLRPAEGTPARVVSIHGDAAGPHWSQRLRGHVAAGWETIQLFGLPIGRGQLDAQIYDGKLTFAPLDVGVGQDGRLTTSAVARLVPPPAELMIPAGRVIGDVEITPEVSGRMLKYFIPSLADAVETQGTFSIDTEGGRMPLANPLAAEASGNLTVHAAQVRPGRVGRDWILLAEQIEALLKSREVPRLSTRPQRDLMTFDEQTVPYRISGGRVYHENLVFNVGEVRVRSHGSVGFDQTLAIEVEVPVQDAWIEGKPQLARFKGKSIRGTIRGTFEKIDYGTLISDLAQQVGQGLIEGALEQELNRALDRLLQPR